jgi:hypothetical protein
MALNTVFKPFLEAVQYVFEEPGGVFMMSAVTVDNGISEQLTIAPPTSLKLFRNAQNKSELLVLGLAGNALLSRRIPSERQSWLESLGWHKPQEPFNNFYSMTERGDLPLSDLLELAVESWVVAYGVTPSTPIAMHLSLEQQNFIAEKFLPMHTQTFLYTLPGQTANVVIEPEPPKKTRAKKEALIKGTSDAPPVTSTPKEPSATESKALKIGDRANIMAADTKGNPVEVSGLIVGESQGKARFEVTGSPHVPNNVYLIPWESLLKTNS